MLRQPLPRAALAPAARSGAAHRRAAHTHACRAGAAVARAARAVATIAALVGACAAPLAQAAPRAGALPAVVPSCSWDRPGHEPFMGDVVAAVDRYVDIDPAVRARLKARMARRDYDEVVSIRRDAITGRGKYGTTIRDMHFGDGRMCRSVTRERWTAAMQERGLVYCEERECILVPTVCRNVSRITRAIVSPAHAEAPPDDDAGALPQDDPAADRARPHGMSTAIALGDAPAFGAPPGTGGLTADDPENLGTGATASGATPGSFAGGSSEPLAGVGRWPFDGLPAYRAGPAAAGAPGGGVTGPLPPVAAFPAPPPPGPLIAAPPVPEPQTWALLAVGLAAVAAVARRRRLRR